jgi:hypothetical protein
MPDHDELDYLEEISPSAGFREAVWTKINRLKRRKTFFDMLLPSLPAPAWALTVVLTILAMGLGIKRGQILDTKDEGDFQIATEQGISSLSASYPINSIESWVVKATFSPTEEK